MPNMGVTMNAFQLVRFALVAGDSMRQLLVAANAVLLKDLDIAWLDADGLMKIHEREPF